MNQIIYNCKFENKYSDQSNNKVLFKNTNNTSRINSHYKITFIISLFLLVTSTTLLIINKYMKLKKESVSNNLKLNYTVMTLYSKKDKKYNLKALENFSNQSPFIIGLIQIDKIKLSYPILSSISDDLLKISPCRFAGPMPNQKGNLCIAAHNYVDNKFFSNLFKLELKDRIKIFDLSSKSIEYEIYNIEEVRFNDFSCTIQPLEDLKMITLITCNNVSGNRLCIKAKEII